MHHLAAVVAEVAAGTAGLAGEVLRVHDAAQLAGVADRPRRRRSSRECGCAEAGTGDEAAGSRDEEEKAFHGTSVERNVALIMEVPDRSVYYPNGWSMSPKSVTATLPGAFSSQARSARLTRRPC